MDIIRSVEQKANAALCMSSPVASLPALKATPVLLNMAGEMERWVLLVVRYGVSLHSKAKPDWNQIILRGSGWVGNFC